MSPPPFRKLHWLPIQDGIDFKISLLKYRVHTNSSPSYISPLTTPLQSRRDLQSSSQAEFVITKSLRTFVNSAFALAGPVELNKLLDCIRKWAPLSPFKTDLQPVQLVQNFYD